MLGWLGCVDGVGVVCGCYVVWFCFGVVWFLGVLDVYFLLYGLDWCCCFEYRLEYCGCICVVDDWWWWMFCIVGGWIFVCVGSDYMGDVVSVVGWWVDFGCDLCCFVWVGSFVGFVVILLGVDVVGCVGDWVIGLVLL